MRLFITFVALLGVTSAYAQDQVLPGKQIYQFNNTIAYGAMREFRTSFSVPNGSLIITTIPCFGAYDWYVGYNYPPNATVNNGAQKWADTSRIAQTTLGFLTRPFAYTGHVLVVGTDNNYDGVSAQFDVIAAVSDAAIGGPGAIIPPNDATVSGSSLDHGNGGTMTYHKTDNTSDQYSVFTYPGAAVPTGGYFPFSACGVLRWMTPFNSDNGDVKDNGDGTFTVTVKNLSPTKSFTTTVVVSRPGYYNSSYTSYVFNGSNSLQVTYNFLLFTSLFSLLLFLA